MSAKITIAQALRRIKKLKGELAEHQSRAASCSSWVQDKPTTYSFNAEVEAIRNCQRELLNLESRVAVANATNNVTVNNVQMNLSELIRQLQEIKGEIAWLKSLSLRTGSEKSREVDFDEATGRNVYRTVEVVYVAAMSEQERNEKVKYLQDRFEDWNNSLESANHQVLV